MKLISFFKKEPVKRAVRTFGQAAVGYILANIAFIDLSSGKDVAKSALFAVCGCDNNHIAVACVVFVSLNCSVCR